MFSQWATHIGSPDEIQDDQFHVDFRQITIFSTSMSNAIFQTWCPVFLWQINNNSIKLFSKGSSGSFASLSHCASGDRWEYRVQLGRWNQGTGFPGWEECTAPGVVPKQQIHQPARSHARSGHNSISATIRGDPRLQGPSHKCALQRNPRTQEKEERESQ